MSEVPNMVNLHLKNSMKFSTTKYIIFFKTKIFFCYFLGTVIALRDSGWYSCAAVSESGSILSRAEVNVAQNADRPPPIIQLGKKTSLEMKDVSFVIFKRCVFHGYIYLC